VSTSCLREAKEEGVKLEKAFEELELNGGVVDSSSGFRDRRKLNGSRRR
jgi:hypothetical protein